LNIELSGTGVRLKLNSIKDEKVSLFANHVILASGAVLNGILANRLTGTSKFHLGNHLTVSGFRHIIKPSLSRQTVHYPGVSRWASFSISTDASSALRFVQDSRVAGIREILGARGKPQSLNNFVHLAKNRLRIASQVESIIMFDVAPKKYLEVETDAQTKAKKTTTTLYMRNSSDISKTTEKIKEDYENHLTQIQDDFSEPRSLEAVDAAHYYGSTPMLDDPQNELSVDEDSKLRGCDARVTMLGSSVFPEGGHGHPTLLLMSLASWQMEKF
jgi:hypothetical protein